MVPRMKYLCQTVINYSNKYFGTNNVIRVLIFCKVRFLYIAMHYGMGISLLPFYDRGIEGRVNKGPEMMRSYTQQLLRCSKN